METALECLGVGSRFLLLDGGFSSSLLATHSTTHGKRSEGGLVFLGGSGFLLLAGVFGGFHRKTVFCCRSLVCLFSINLHSPKKKSLKPAFFFFLPPLPPKIQVLLGFGRRSFYSKKERKINLSHPSPPRTPTPRLSLEVFPLSSLITQARLFSSRIPPRRGGGKGDL